MRVPGGNLYNKAISLIQKQTVAYYAYTGRTTNDYGVDVATYAAPVNITGSLQAVPRNRYTTLGLDFQKDYVTLFCPRNLLDLQRDVSGDLFTYDGRTFKVESLTDWFAQDGWVQALAVQTTANELPDPPPPPEEEGE